jgi:general stress protein YciG
MKSTKQVSQPKKAHRGFAAMDPQLQLKIATMGGRKISRNREHMAQIGGIGGTATQRNWNRKVKAMRKGKP